MKSRIFYIRDSAGCTRAYKIVLTDSYEYKLLNRTPSVQDDWSRVEVKRLIQLAHKCVFLCVCVCVCNAVYIPRQKIHACFITAVQFVNLFNAPSTRKQPLWVKGGLTGGWGVKVEWQRKKKRNGKKECMHIYVSDYFRHNCACEHSVSDFRDANNQAPSVCQFRRMALSMSHAVVFLANTAMTKKPYLMHT